MASALKAIVMAATLALTGCVTDPALLVGAAPPFVAKVVVTKSAQLGSVNMPEDLRVKVLQRSSTYARSGSPKTLDVQITDVGFKNPLAALMVGDSNRVSVTVRVVDSLTGKVDASYVATAVDSAAINGIAGALISAADDPIDIEQRLAEAAARSLLQKLYGTEAARAADGRALDTKVVGHYPRPYADLKTEARCKILADAKSTSDGNPRDMFHGRTAPLPPECADVGVVAKPAKRV
jgi:hypothetical protein